MTASKAPSIYELMKIDPVVRICSIAQVCDRARGYANLYAVDYNTVKIEVQGHFVEVDSGHRENFTDWKEVFIIQPLVSRWALGDGWSIAFKPEGVEEVSLHYPFQFWRVDGPSSDPACFVRFSI